MPEHVLEDPDARLGGNDSMPDSEQPLVDGLPDHDPIVGDVDPTPDQVLLEKLHAEAEQVKAQRTSYEVSLHVRESIGPRWEVLDVYEASSPREAMRAAAVEHDVVSGATLRAVAKRYITELTLAMTVTTRLELS